MQQPTERTSLTRPFEPHSYVEFAGIIRNRRNKVRQFQCCICAAFIATFIMALIVTVSYSVNHPDVIPPESNVSEVTLEAGAPKLLKLSGVAEAAPEILSVEEVQLALEAGNAAIDARRLADSRAKPLPEPSPESRHQFAVGTGSRAERIAMAGVAEIAATRKLESSRSFLGKPSRFGSFLDGGWAADELCARKLNDVRCPPYPGKYREIDGSCNHPQQLGSAYTPYRRAVPADYADGIDAPRVGKFGTALPSAREVSLKVHPPSPSTNPSFTVMLAVFGQFLDHDITATAISQGINGSSLSCCPPSAGHPECFPVKVGPGDPVYDIAASSCMEFVRSAPAAQCRIGPRQQLNQVTAFIDGSTIYGSDLETANNLREFVGGRLRMQKTPDNRELLPASTNPKDGCNRKVELARGRYCFASGDRRANENLHLTTMHVLWARQHNRLVDRLSQLNPQWDDETLYQEARRIVGAQLQHISYREFVPIVLGEAEVAGRNLRPLDSGFRPINDTDVDPSIANNFAASAFRFAHTLLPGLMKVTDSQKGTSSYVQLHRMLFNPYSLYAEGGLESSITSATTNPIQKTSTHVTSQLTEHLFEDPMGNQTSVPCGLDLVSLNIQRGRDHGLPGYTKWREHCGLGNPLNFQDLKDDMDPEALDAISKLYDNVDDIDLYTGALAELPKGMGLLGPTFTCLIADQFERLQLGDRYWYESANQSGSFSEDQLKEIRKTTLARIICDTSDGINQVQQEVMKSVSTDNPIVSCEDIPQLSLDAWKSEMPLLTMSDTAVPLQDWINFKYEVNKTLTDIISNIVDNKPPPGSLPTDWLDFQNGINKTFTDLKNKFSALHPKMVTNVKLAGNLKTEPGAFDWASIKNDVDSTVLDIIDSISANKPPPGSLPADWLSYKKKINDSLIDIRKKFKILHPKTANLKSSSENVNQLKELPIIDWSQIKNDINSTITDVVNSINASKPLPGSPPADWFAFKSKIVNSLVDVKNKFKGLHPKPNVIVSSTANLNSDDGIFDWTSIQNDVDSTVLDIIDSISANKPPPGSLPADWLAYKKQINDSLIGIRKKFKILHPKTANLKSSSENINQLRELPIIDWNQIKDDINSTIKDIVNSINASKPLPGSPPADWFAFKSKIVNSLVDVKNKFKGLHPKPSVIVSSTANLNSEDGIFDWASVKNDVDSTVVDILDSINANKPLPGSLPADWLAYKKKINDSLIDIRKKFKILHPKAANLKSSSENINQSSESPIIDWIQIKDDINSTIADIVNSINASKPLPGSPPADWLAFKKKIVSSLTDVKNKFTSFSPKVKYSNLKLTATNDQPPFDWVEFKNKLNKSLNNTIASIVSKNPPAGSKSDDWLQFQKEVNKTLDDFIVQFADSNPNVKVESDQLTSDKLNKDTENNVNKSVSEIIAEINASKPEPGSPPEDWDIFRKKMTDAFVNMNTKYIYPQKKNKTKVKLSNPTIDANFDEEIFRDNLNKSLSDLISVIKNQRPAINSSMPDWLAYKSGVKVSLNKIKDLFAEFKKKEMMGPDYVLYAGENEKTFDWLGWKTEINKTIDNLIDNVKNISPSDDPKWISFRDYLNKSFVNIKNKASLLKTEVSRSKLMSVIEDDWLTFKDKVNETIEEALDDIISNKPTVGDPAWLNYSVYIKNRFAEMHEKLITVKTEWLDKLKVATDQMIITDVPIGNNSASLLTLSHLKFSTFVLFIVYITNFMRLSI